MTDKIAFLFLTRGEHNNINLWEKFFEKADLDKFKIFIHPKEISLLKSSLWNHPNSTILRPIPTAWGSITLVKATLYLMQIAFMDPLVKKFVLLSESCIPTTNFNSVYDISILENGRSRINWTFGKNIDRYNLIKTNLPPNITPHNWIKQSQWMCLDRKHVHLLFQPNLQNRFTQLLQNFQHCPVPDEHFFINYFIHILKLHPTEFINHPITFVDWNSNSKHPKLFAFLSTDIIKLCRDNKIFFARKFTPLNLSSSDIDYILNIKEPTPIKTIDIPDSPHNNIQQETSFNNQAIQNIETSTISNKTIQHTEDNPSEKLQNNVDERPKDEPNLLLSKEQKEIFDFFNCTPKDLCHKIFQLTALQIDTIYSSLFKKSPPALLSISNSISDSDSSSDSDSDCDSDSDSDSSSNTDSESESECGKNNILKLSIIEEEPENLDENDYIDDCSDKTSVQNTEHSNKNIQQMLEQPFNQDIELLESSYTKETTAETKVILDESKENSHLQQNPNRTQEYSNSQEIINDTKQDDKPEQTSNECIQINANSIEETEVLESSDESIENNSQSTDETNHLEHTEKEIKQKNHKKNRSKKQKKRF